MTRDEISALLPFLANGTLEGKERAEVEAAVAADATLQTELAALRAIRETMQSEDSYSPGEMGLARLMRDAETQVPATRIQRPWIWQAAAAVLLAVVIGQAVLTNREPVPGGFELAGADDAPISAAFAPDTPESELRDLLLRAGVEIAAGPSAIGIYRLEPLEGTDLSEAARILRAADFVESLEVSDDQ
ncbi:MAG: hypothetical protein QNJ44_20805 [Rhodobacter sp.]|nr:hypothetical protein [Rhodobacter sp.]